MTNQEQTNKALTLCIEHDEIINKQACLLVKIRNVPFRQLKHSLVSLALASKTIDEELMTLGCTRI